MMFMSSWLRDSIKIQQNHRFVNSHLNLYSSLPMLLLLAMILGMIVPGQSIREAIGQPSTRSQFNETSIKSTHGSIKSNETIQSGQINLNHRNQTGYKTTLAPLDPSIKLVLLGSDKNGTSRDDHWNNQVNRLSYNFSFPVTSSSANQTSRQANYSATDDPMEVSDSRFLPQHRLSSRMDSDLESTENYGDEEAISEAEAYIEGASSNLNEKKVVKELTKILSKGMSGATDQVRLETLENWKRRQRERKAIKDTRAKLFEDLITAAISSHPDRAKRGSRNSSKEPSTANLKSSNSTAGLLNNPKVDSEMAADAETVIQHLQGLATAIDTHSPATLTDDALATSNDEYNAADDSSSSLSPTSSADADSSESETEPEQKPKKGSSSSERPIVRQFKKIKNQISQRRKQLEQIKKLFNVELTINPKDGTLISKPAAGGKKRPSSPETSQNDYKEDTETDGGQTSSKRKSNQSNREQAKMREMMNYLRDNPEILASVMAELTVDADPSNRAWGPQSLYGGRNEEAPYMPALKGGNDMNVASVSNRKATLYSSSSKASGDGGGSGGHGYDTDNQIRERARRLSHLYEADGLDLPELQSKRSRSRSSSRSLLDGLYPTLSKIRDRSAESLLLEQLRERQLLNLARLDVVLAEKQQASNRSLFYAAHNASSVYSPSLFSPSSINRSDNLDLVQRLAQRLKSLDSAPSPTSSNGQRPMYNNQGNTNASRSRVDEEILHHFMVVNSSNQNNSDSMSRLASNGNGGLHGGQNPAWDQPARAYDQYNGASLVQQYSNPSGSLQNQANRYGQQQSGSAAPLKRFRDWRDVSQSEASSSQHDRINSANNVTWLPYDLSTGGSSAAVEAQSARASSPIPQSSSNYRVQAHHHHYHHHHQQQQQQQLQNYQRQPAINYNESGSSNFVENSQGNLQQNAADLSVTRPGQAFNMNLQQDPYQSRLINPTNSMFMTRSNVAEGDVTGRTNQLEDESRRGGGGDDDTRISDRSDDADQVTNGEIRYNSNNIPVDYFSAYKQEMPSKRRLSSLLSPTNQELSRLVKRRELPALTDDDPETDDMGAMWAK